MLPFNIPKQAHEDFKAFVDTLSAIHPILNKEVVMKFKQFRKKYHIKVTSGRAIIKGVSTPKTGYISYENAPAWELAKIK